MIILPRLHHQRAFAWVLVSFISRTMFVDALTNPLTFDDLKGLLRNGARGQFEETIQGLQELWQDMPEYVDKFLDYRESLTDEVIDEEDYPRKERIQETEDSGRCRLAGHITRFALEVGNLTLAKQYFNASKGTNHIRVNNPLLEGDLQFAFGNYPAAIGLYQGAVALGKDPHHLSHLMGRFWNDDVSFTKIAFCYASMGQEEDAKKNWDYAAQLQLAKGLYLEAILSFLRMGNWEQANTVLAEEKDLLVQYYPTIASVLKKGPPAALLLGEPTEMAFYALIEGNYRGACQLLDKVGDDSHEKWGLLSIVLRERQLDDLAECYSELAEDDPFSLLRRAVLRKNVKQERFWGATPTTVKKQKKATEKRNKTIASDKTSNTLDALFGSRFYPFEPDVYQETPQTLLLKAKEKLPSFSATIDYQIATYLGSSFISSSFQNEEEEQTFFREMQDRLTYLEMALAAPSISTAVWIKSTLLQLNTELSIDEQRNLNYANGQMLAATETSGPKGVHFIVSEAVVGNDGNTKPYVPPKPKRNEDLRIKREAILAKCWERLESEEGMATSLVALDLARQGKSGVLERQLVANIFGKESTPSLQTREAEAYEDMREGTGKRAEELFRQLAEEQDDSSSNRKQHYQSQLARALEQQHKYGEAIEVLEDLKAEGSYERSMGEPSYYLLQVAELHQKNEEFDMALEKYRELSMVDRNSERDGRWTVYGFLGMGDIALERGNLEDALEEFYRGVQVARDYLNAKIGTDEESNAVSGLANAWMNSGESLSKYGYPERALEFYEECRKAAQTDNKFWNSNFREGYEKRIALKIGEVAKQIGSRAEGD